MDNNTLNLDKDDKIIVIIILSSYYHIGVLVDNLGIPEKFKGIGTSDSIMEYLHIHHSQQPQVCLQSLSIVKLLPNSKAVNGEITQGIYCVITSELPCLPPHVQ